MRCERRTGVGGSERRARGSPSPNQMRDTSGRVKRTRGVHDDGEAASELGPTLTHCRACPDGQDGAGHARGPGTRPGLNSAADGPGVCDGSVEGGKRHRERGTHRCVGSAGRCLGMITASSQTAKRARNRQENFFDSTGLLPVPLDTSKGAEMVEVVDLLSDSGEDEEIRPASSPIVILDDPSPPEPAPSSKRARAGSQSDASSSDLSDGGFRAAMASRPVVGMRSAAERILLGVGSRPPMPPRPTSRRESDEGDAYFSDDSPVIAMSQRDRGRLDKAREHDRERARKAAEKEDERARSRHGP